MAEQLDSHPNMVLTRPTSGIEDTLSPIIRRYNSRGREIQTREIIIQSGVLAFPIYTPDPSDRVHVQRTIQLRIKHYRTSEVSESS